MSQTSRKASPLRWVPTAYFAMGLPLIMLNLVAPIMFNDFGISDTQVAFWTSLLILPWSLKPFWSPLMEMYRTKKFFVVTTQLLSGVSLALVAMALPLPDFFPYAVAIMAVIAFSGATHDIALDGVYMHELSKTQQAQYIGWQGAFYNIAKVTAMGGLVYLAGVLEEHVGVLYAWMTIMGLCGGILILLGLYHLRMLPSGGGATASADGFRETMRETWSVFMQFFRKRYIWIYIAFIVFYRFAEGLVIKIVPLFLKAPVADQGMGLTKSEIGLYYGTFGVVAFIVGSILGGYFISWRGLRRALFPLCCIFNVPFAVYALLAWAQPSNPVLVCGAIVFEYFSYGFGFVGLTLFIMQQVAPGKHQMAHYAFGSALANLGVMLPGMISGLISDAVGYRAFFLWALLATLPAFICTWLVPFTHPDTTAGEAKTAEAVEG
ncbi:MFS transporter [Alistipes sp.]|uniref:MFS transporter n=1 Tax=Alistipes sp. TaxID=1872444 RepID=UPI003AEF4115